MTAISIFFQSGWARLWLGLGVLVLAGLLGWISLPSGNGGSKSEPVIVQDDFPNDGSQDIQSAVPRKGTMGERLAAEFARAEPEGDEWDTEKFHVVAKSRLGELADALKHPEDLASVEFEDLLAVDCEAGFLRPDQLATRYEVQGLSVLRPENPENLVGDFKGREAVEKALAELAKPLTGKEEIRVKFKIFRVTPREKEIETSVIFHSYGGDKGNSIQQNATWRIVWVAGEDEETPMIARIFPESYEEVRAALPSGKGMRDCTASLMGAVDAYESQLLPGASHWSRNLSQRLGGEPGGYKGLALGDVNGDALDDLYLCQTGGLPNRLLVQRSDGTLEDRSAEAGVDFLDLTRSALFVDLDNDGDQDLVIAMRRQLLLMSNDGSGNFEEAGVLASRGAPYSLSSADFDNDGDLDLYVCNYGNVWAGIAEFEHHVPIPMHDAENGSPNMLLRNEGGLSFTDVTAETGLDQNNRRWSLSAAWEDFDNDGDQDLYVANDFGRNNLYRNDPGDLPGERRFIDVAPALATEDLSPGMSANWGDCNNDGLMDLYVSNMFSGAGNRITFQDRFMPEADPSIRRKFQRHARGNSLMMNRGAEKPFEDVTSSSGVGVGRWAWSSTFADLNNDTLSDILVANGYVTETDTTDL